MFSEGRSVKTKTRYNIYYDKYEISINAYLRCIKVVYTDDIYHEVGKLVCTSLERVENIRYTKPSTSVQECEKLWLDSGFKKVSENFWARPKKQESEK